jgi:hypothetical protein
MRSFVMRHGKSCSCPAHRKRSRAEAGGLWATLLPFLACAVCPACVSTYAKVLATLGIGFGLTAAQHEALLFAAVCSSVAVSAWRAWSTRRSWPLMVALLGSGLLLLGHFLGDLHVVEWAGMLILLLGGVTEQLRLRRSRTRFTHVAQ